LLAAGTVPEAEGMVPGSTGEPAAIWAKRDPAHLARVSAQPVDQSARGDLPQANGIVPRVGRTGPLLSGGAGQPGAVRAEGNAPDFGCVVFQRPNRSAIGSLPQAHGSFGGSTGQVLAIGTEGHAVDGSLVPLESVQQLAPDGVPDPHGPVVAGA